MASYRAMHLQISHIKRNDVPNYVLNYVLNYVRLLLHDLPRQLRSALFNLGHRQVLSRCSILLARVTLNLRRNGDNVGNPNIWCRNDV